MRWESWRRRVSGGGGGANGCLPLAEGGDDPDEGAAQQLQACD
jgi:hypothetical protein